MLVPSEDYHLSCTPSNFERSKTGLPYPKHDIFAQSLLDMLELNALADLVDGMNLTEEWGEQHLDLSGTNDVPWAERKNERIRASIPLTENSCLLELGAAPFSSRETWEMIVGRKTQRLGWEYEPKELWATRFRGRDEEDPRSRDRNYV